MTRPRLGQPNLRIVLGRPESEASAFECSHSGADLPLVIAGGPLAGDPSVTIDDVAGTNRSVARGIGRNIWQREKASAEQVLSQIAALTRKVTFNE